MQQGSQLIGEYGALTNLATGIAYAPFGPLKTLTYGNGLALSRGYDQNYWLTGITLTGSGAPLLDLAFGRDGNGNVTGVTDNAATARAAAFTYTDNDRLQTATGLWGSDIYSWDASGNRTRVDRTLSGSTVSDVATILPASNRLTEIRDGAGVLSKSFALSTGGDMASQAVAGGPATDYVYSPRGRLTSLKIDGTEVASYLYDYAGHRVVWTIPATPQTVHYVYDKDGHALAEHDGVTGALLREYVWLAAKRKIRQAIKYWGGGLAQMTDAGGSSLANAAAWLEGTLLGSIATVIAVLAIATVGFLMLSGRIDWRRGAGTVIGCFILFGAPTIAAGIMGAASSRQADYAQTAVFEPVIPLSTPGQPADHPQSVCWTCGIAPASPAPVADPYAGASVAR